MIKTDPVFNSKMYIDYAYHPCNQAYEDEVKSGVVCKDSNEGYEYLKQNDQRVGFWWMHQHIVANQEVEDNNAFLSFLEPHNDKFPYKLYPNRH